MKRHLSTLFVIAVMLISCQSDIGKISNAKKSVVFPGVPQAERFVKYQAEVELYKPVSIDKIVIKNAQTEIPVTEFTLIRIPDGKIMSNADELKAGKYFFEADIQQIDVLENTDDELVIGITDKGKQKLLKVKVEKALPIMRK